MHNILSIADLCRLVNHNGGAILDQISMQEVDTFLEIKELLPNTNADSNENFQALYQQIYKLKSARMKQGVITHYFKVLEEEKTQFSLSPRRICNEVFGSGRVLHIRQHHFNMITQMLNTVNETYPIVDQGLCQLFDFEGPTQSSLSNGERINIYVDFYNQVRLIYKEIIEENSLYDILKVLEIKLKSQGRKLSVIKRLDLVMRAVGALEKKGSLIAPVYKPAYTMA